MLKKLMMVFMAVTLLFAFTVSSNVDAAKRMGGGGYKSGVKSHTTTPNKTTPNQSTTKDNYSNTNGAKSTTGAAATPNRGFFGGGSFLKGMMIGGLAGMLFGGLFGNLGGLGSLLGLAVNIFAIYLIIVIAAALFRRFTNKQRKPDPKDGRY